MNTTWEINWEHDIKMIGRAPATRFFEVVSGEGHGAAEDVGSRSGWKRLCEAYAAGKPTKEQREQMAWYEKRCLNGDSRGLGNGVVFMFDKEHTNHKLLSLEPIG